MDLSQKVNIKLPFFLILRTLNNLKIWIENVYKLFEMVWLANLLFLGFTLFILWRWKRPSNQNGLFWTIFWWLWWVVLKRLEESYIRQSKWNSHSLCLNNNNQVFMLVHPWSYSVINFKHDWIINWFLPSHNSD